MDFGNTLRGLIEDKDKSQKEVALDLNIAPTTLGNYIRNQREPDFETLIAIANYFDVSVDYLLGNVRNNELSQDEQRLIKLYSQIPKQNKVKLIEIARILR